MIKSQVRQLLDRCFAEGVAQGLWSLAAADSYVVEVPKHESHGDFSTNMAMIIAGRDNMKPRDVAARIVEMLSGDEYKFFVAARVEDRLLDKPQFLDKVEVAGPGFVNFFINEAVWRSVLRPVCTLDHGYGRSDIGQGRRVLVEFVSANPTGPLSIGHGRQGILGDAIARLLEQTGHAVTREYYYNDAGRQMRVLGESTRARYLELLGLESAFPEDGYQGDYIREIAEEMVREAGDSLGASQDLTPFKKKAEEAIFADIKKTLDRMDIRFDSYFNEHSLYENGLIDEVVAALRDKGLVYEQDGAVWFMTSELGLEQDRVIIKSSGEPTYRLPDIAYHREKFRRGFDWLVDIFGSDHIGTVPDVLAGVRALGYDDTMVKVVIHQFVTLTRDGKQVKMSTRKATFVTVDELLDEVGADVVRFFFLTRKADSQLEFDLDLAKKESQENPVYYVQYANARLASIQKKAREKGISRLPLAEAPISRLIQPEEMTLLKILAAFPDLVEQAALALEPHRIIFFMVDLAGRFHSYYNRHKVISDDEELTQARLWLAEALRIVLRNGLRTVGLSAPDSM